VLVLNGWIDMAFRLMGLDSKALISIEATSGAIAARIRCGLRKTDVHPVIIFGSPHDRSLTPTGRMPS
jgi:hypothetical protein